MRVRVLLFGPHADVAGCSHVEVEVPDGATCDAVRAALGGTVPALVPSLSSSRLAVNARFARGDQVIRSGDEVALIGLVSGG